MADIKVEFVNGQNSRRQEGRVDDGMTGQQVVAELVEAGFVSRAPGGYELGRKGGDLLDMDLDLRSAGVRDGDVLEVMPIAEAGRAARRVDR